MRSALLRGLLGLLVGACVPDDPGLGASSGPGETGETGSPTTGGAPVGEVMCEPVITAVAEQDFAQVFTGTLCAQKDGCGCPDPACEATFGAAFAALAQAAKDQRLTYDEACAVQTLASYVTARGCLPGSVAEYPGCMDCDIFRGDIALGEACETTFDPPLYLFGEACAGDAYCLDPVCTDMAFAELKLGEACESDEQTIFGACADGLECDYLDSYVCEPALDEGENCNVTDGVCRGELRCLEGVCAAYGEVGEACADDYDCDLFNCVDAKCADYVWVCEVRDVSGLFGSPFL